jgi:manganese efflux pump family protein
MIVMAVAALIAWVLTAGGGFVMLSMWLANGALRQRPRSTHLPVPVVFGHFLLAAAGLVVWIVYLLGRMPVLAWVALILLVLVALGGFVMLARWVPVYRARAGVSTSAGPSSGGAGATAGGQDPPERRFPVAVVGGHGVLAVATLVLVLLTLLGRG